MSKFWVVLVILLSMILVTSSTVKSDDVLIDAEIYRGIDPQRRLNKLGLQRGYSWEFENKLYTALIVIDEQWYNTIRNEKKKRMYNNRHFPQMVYRGVKALQELINEFEEVIPNKWVPERRINFVLAFVQSIPWTDDRTTGYDEFYKYATETLAEGKGDCEDTSILFAAILSGLGFQSALLNLPGHLAVGVKGNFREGYEYKRYGNDKYYYCETTSKHRKLGNMPKRYEGKDVWVMPITPNPIQPRLVKPRKVPPTPNIPIPPSPQNALQDGINLFYDARYNEAIKSLQLALSSLNDPKQRAEAYIYLGKAEYTFAADSLSDAIDRAKARFQDALRENPEQEFNHPKFIDWFEEVHRESIGELTVSASLPQTEIWIHGNGIKRKMLGIGNVRRKLFMGNYTLEGIYEGRSVKKTVKITPNSHEELKIKIPPAFVDDSPPRIVLLDPVQTAEINQRVTLEAKVTDDISVRSVYLSCGFARSENSRPSVYRRKKFAKSDSTTYIGYIQTPSEIGYIWYYLTATDGRGNQSQTKPRVLEIGPSHERVPLPPYNQPPIIELVNLPQITEVNQRITIQAKVTDDTRIKSVFLYYRFSQSYILEQNNSIIVYSRRELMETRSGVYTGHIPSQSKVGYIWYYLTATDEGGEEGKSEDKVLEVLKVKPPDEPYAQVEPSVVRPVKPARKPSRSFVVSESKSPTHEGIWANHAWLGNIFGSSASAFDWSKGDTLSFAYLREGKTHQTFGAQLDISYHNSTDSSATLQWGPALGESPIVFTFLGGVTGYRISDSDHFETMRTPLVMNRDVSDASSYITPVLGASLKLYPLDSVTIGATGSLKLPSVFDTTYLHHYEIGMRIYIARPLNLRIGYGQWYIGSRNITKMQVGLGFTF